MDGWVGGVGVQLTEAGRQAGRQAGGQAGRRAGGQAGRRAGGQAGRRAGGQAGRQRRTQWSVSWSGRQAVNQAGRQAGCAGRGRLPAPSPPPPPPGRRLPTPPLAPGTHGRRSGRPQSVQSGWPPPFRRSPRKRWLPCQHPRRTPPRAPCTRSHRRATAHIPAGAAGGMQACMGTGCCARRRCTDLLLHVVFLLPSCLHGVILRHCQQPAARLPPLLPTQLLASAAAAAAAAAPSLLFGSCTSLQHRRVHPVQRAVRVPALQGNCRTATGPAGERCQAAAAAAARRPAPHAPSCWPAHRSHLPDATAGRHI